MLSASLTTLGDSFLLLLSFRLSYMLRMALATPKQTDMPYYSTGRTRLNANWMRCLRLRASLASCGIPNTLGAHSEIIFLFFFSPSFFAKKLATSARAVACPEIGLKSAPAGGRTHKSESSFSVSFFVCVCVCGPHLRLGGSMSGQAWGSPAGQ